MARNKGPQFAHRPKDYCTLEQAAELARLAAQNEFAKCFGAHLLKHHKPAWYKRLWRRILRTKP